MHHSPLYGFELVTTEVLYRLPDYPDILNVFIWQTYDRPPELRRVMAFIRHWQNHIEAPIAGVKVACAGLFHPQELRHVNGVWILQ